jgi:hypothetical protein
MTPRSTPRAPVRTTQEEPGKHLVVPVPVAARSDAEHQERDHERDDERNGQQDEPRRRPHLRRLSGISRADVRLSRRPRDGGWPGLHVAVGRPTWMMVPVNKQPQALKRNRSAISNRIRSGPGACRSVSGSRLAEA